jgi:hypothetical protein
MSAMNSYALDWLTDGGFKLGYDMDTLPSMRDMSWVLSDRVKAGVYFSSSTFRHKHREFLKLTGRSK